jgi:hypothetical protein
MQQQLSASLFEVFEINLFRKTFTSSRWLLAAAGRTFLSLFSSKTYNPPPHHHSSPAIYPPTI